MPDKIVNHFVLADGSTAKYDYDALENTPDFDAVQTVELADLLSRAEWEQGSLNMGTGLPYANDTRILSNYIDVSNSSLVKVSIENGYKWAMCTYDDIDVYDAYDDYCAGQNGLNKWHTDSDYFVVIRPGINYVKFLVSMSDDSTITVDAKTALTVKENFNLLTKLENINTEFDILGGLNITLESWTRGVPSGNSKYLMSSITRLCTKFIDVPKSTKFIHLTAPAGYKVAYYLFDETGNFLDGHFWGTEYTFAVSSTYKKIVVGLSKIDNSTILPSDGSATITFYGNSKQIVDNISDLATIDLDWEIGSLTPNSGAELGSANRIRSRYVLVGKGTTLFADSTTNHLIYTFDLDKNYVSDIAWTNNVITVDKDCYIRILIAKSSNATITTEEIDTLAKTETIYRTFPQYLIDNEKSGTDTDTSVIYNIPENIHKKAEIDTFKQKKIDLESWGQCDLKAMFFTDVHGDSARTERMTELVNNWGTSYFDCAICGGDIAQLIITESLDWYYTATADLDVPLLNTVGNHDAWENLNGTLAPKTDVYNKIIAPIATSSNIVQPADASTNGYNYYYKDFGTVRVIVIDCMYWDATQLAWLESVLADAKTNSKHVLCVSHSAFPLASMERVNCLWSKSGVNTDSTRTNVQACNAVKEFMDNGGDFIAWVVGHQHGDFVHVLPDYNNQFVVNLASFAQRAGWLLKNTDNTKYNYDCLTYIAVDTTNKNIRFMRIGADVDIFGTQYHGLVIDYGNNELVSSY